MNIGLDLDDVLIDVHIIQSVIDDYNLDLTMDDIKHWDLRDLPKDAREETFRRFKDAHYNCDRVKPIEGVSETLRTWKRQGHKLIVITSRPKEIALETIDMVQNKFPDVDKVIVANHGEKKKYMIEEHLDMFVDDAPKYIHEANEAKIPKVFLISNKHTPYNHEYRDSEKEDQFGTVKCIKDIII